ncbi:hypothetical protein DL96DRAFT_508574 [Flagelloscypha sp. PMI_526]|nr:hypothetical protein DL96DRAFT_508574 [Flagelloscypha sp. PMI_526]
MAVDVVPISLLTTFLVTTASASLSCYLEFFAAGISHSEFVSLKWNIATFLTVFVFYLLTFLHAYFISKQREQSYGRTLQGRLHSRNTFLFHAFLASWTIASLVINVTDQQPLSQRDPTPHSLGRRMLYANLGILIGQMVSSIISAGAIWIIRKIRRQGIGIPELQDPEPKTPNRQSEHG